MRVLSLILDDKTRAFSRAEKLAAESLTFASGLHSPQGSKSQTEIGKERGVCRAAVSRRSTKFIRELGLHPSSGSKSPAAVEAYRTRELAKAEAA